MLHVLVQLEFIFDGRHQTGKRACTRAEAWSLRLQPYDFRVKYVPGAENIADSLFRLCEQKDEAFDEASELFLCAIEKMGNKPRVIPFQEIATETKSDGTLQKVLKAIETNSWLKSDQDFNGFRQYNDELREIKDVVVREDRNILPGCLRQLILEIAHLGHPGVSGMKRTIREMQEMCGSLIMCD